MAPRKFKTGLPTAVEIGGPSSSRQYAGTGPSRLRIVIVLDAPVMAGAENTALALAGELARRGHELVVIACGPPLFEAAIRAASLPCRAITISRPIRNVSLRTWLRVVGQHPADVCLSAKGSFERRSLPLDLAIAIRYPKCVVLENHPALPIAIRPALSWAGWRPRLGLWWWYENWAALWVHARIADRTIAVSHVVGRAFGAIRAMRHQEVHVVHCGIDHDYIRFDQGLRTLARARWGIPETAVVLGAVGRLAPDKRFDRVLAIFAELARADESLWFILGGTGAELGGLRRQAEALEPSLRARVLILGRVPDAREVFCALDVFVMTSKIEGLGIALIEAMACERACIALDSGGPAEILTNRDVGWLVGRDDWDGFDGALREAISLGPEQRRALGRRARRHVVERFDAGVQVGRQADLVESV